MPEADMPLTDIPAPTRDAERLDRVPQDGYWYTLTCGCEVGHIDGKFLHRSSLKQEGRQP